MDEHRLVRFSVRWGGRAASAFRRIKLPPARRDVQPSAYGGFVAGWTPQGELEALAAAIDTYAGAPKVVAFLRRVHRSPVKPKASFDNPF